LSEEQTFVLAIHRILILCVVTSLRSWFT